MFKGGFNLRKWNLNSEEVIDMINLVEKFWEIFILKLVDFI